MDKNTQNAKQEVPDLRLFNHRRALAVILLSVVLIALGSFLWTGWNLREKESAFEAGLEKRLELMARSRTEVISTWLEGLAEQGDRVIRSDIFRLYATEVDLIDGDISYLVAGRSPRGGQSKEQEQIAAQLPMMQSLMLEFTRYAGFLSGRIVNRSGQAYIATDSSLAALDPAQIALVKTAMQVPHPYFSSLRLTSSGLVMDMVLPIFPPEASEKPDVPVAALLLTRAVSDKINELLTASPLATKGERSRLVQLHNGESQEVAPWKAGQLEPLQGFAETCGADTLPFGVRNALGGQDKVYSLGVRVPELCLWVTQEADYDMARQDLRSHARVVYGMTGLIILVFSVSFGAVWSQLISRENRRIAKVFEEQADHIEEQRRLLDSVHNTVPDFIGLKDLRGLYQYVNPAFAEAAGRAMEDMIGLDDAAIFGFDTARRLEHQDQEALAEGHSVVHNEEVYLQSRHRHLQIFKIPTRGKEGAAAGVVSVCRDVTELVEAQQHHEQLMKQTVDALVRAIELTDPYLSGHSRMLGALASELARSLGMDEQEISIIETGANLSQLGKMFIDRELLAKTGPLTRAEKETMEKHVQHALEVLKSIHFDTAIIDAVCQMNERMDGSGYPEGLKGQKIVAPARVLAVVNSFCAMVRPRAYRGARTVEDALQILAVEHAQYDREALEGLSSLVRSHAGENLLARFLEPV